MKNYASRDGNFIPTLTAVSSVDLATIVRLVADPVTQRLLVDANISGANIASHFNTDSFSATNGQTTFTASQTVVQDRGFYISGARATPVIDYTISGSTLTLTAASYPFGIPGQTPCVWDYIY